LEDEFTNLFDINPQPKASNGQNETKTQKQKGQVNSANFNSIDYPES